MEKGSLLLLAQCLSPLLAEIGGFLADRPKNIVRPFVLSSRWLSTEAAFCMDGLWEQMFSARWLAFYGAFSFNGVDDWSRLYQDMIDSRCRCTLDVFEREKKIGFDMAAMPAVVSYEGDTNTYVAKYISASEVNAEVIPFRENHRLRFCPASARQRLQPISSDREGRPRSRLSPEQHHKNRSAWLRPLGNLLRKPAANNVTCARTCSDDLRPNVNYLAQESCPARQDLSDLHPGLAIDKTAYPYKVLEGFEDLVVGEHVELQWKMQELSPFGWWFGQLESIQSKPHSNTAIATIVFAHFPENSNWYRLKLRFGDSKTRHCSFGGFTGGIRHVSVAEKEHWMKFVPRAAQNATEIHRRLLSTP
jgi:hypothetical protein